MHLACWGCPGCKRGQHRVCLVQLLLRGLTNAQESLRLDCIQKRQSALKAEEEKAQAGLQTEQQQILAERGKISDAAFEKKVQGWQNEVGAAQTKFQEKGQAIQNSGQAALGQIEAELIGIIRQEAQAHQMNLILHREQVVLNIAAFDLTDETVVELNKLLPSVKVPPSVVTPGMAITPPDQSQGQ